LLEWIACDSFEFENASFVLAYSFVDPYTLDLIMLLFGVLV